MESKSVLGFTFIWSECFETRDKKNATVQSLPNIILLREPRGAEDGVHPKVHRAFWHMVARQEGNSILRYTLFILGNSSHSTQPEHTQVSRPVFVSILASDCRRPVDQQV